MSVSKVRTTWFGADVKKHVRAISEDAVRETAEKGAATARHSHQWHNRSGKLASSIDTFGVEKSGSTITGSFGYSEPYGLFLEIGSRGRAGSHDLRRAGDREAGSMAERIRAKF